MKLKDVVHAVSRDRKLIAYPPIAKKQRFYRQMSAATRGGVVYNMAGYAKLSITTSSSDFGAEKSFPTGNSVFYFKVNWSIR